ncbi:hypothetical protein HK102_001871 [Quaeritorhiza haematococci]|nr:hypothetical protein HK102_001871 [Quaeritorhiza haematococci]
MALRAWNNLRFDDYSSVAEYVIALNKIAADMRRCGLGLSVTDERLIEKTLLTVPEELRDMKRIWLRECRIELGLHSTGPDCLGI